MAYDFLNTTTYTKDLEEQQQMVDYLQQRAQESNPLDEIGDEDLIEIYNDENDSENLEEVEQEEMESLSDDTHDFENDEPDQTDMEIMQFLLGESEGDMTQAQNVVAPDQVNDLSWLKKKSSTVNLNLGSPLSKYLNSLPEELRKKALATSGNDQSDEHAPNSAHNYGRAVDLRYKDPKTGETYDDLYNYILNDPARKQAGIKLLPLNHGNAPHIHLNYQYGGYNKSKYNFGGKTLVAEDAATLRKGLNNPSYNSAVLKLKGENTIRGLDNNQPVAVTDGSKYQVLVGKNDTAKFNGNVYEKRMQTGGEVKQENTGDVQEEINWLYNWYENRKVSNPNLQRLIDKERKDRLKNLDSGYKVSNNPADIGEGNAASYSPGERRFNMAKDATSDTRLHEATHFSDDFHRPTYGFEERTINKVLPTKKQVQEQLGFGKRNKEDARDYYDYMSDPYEIKARLMNMRRKAGFQPGQEVTEDDLQKFFDDHEGEVDRDTDQLLEFIRVGGKKDFNKKVLNLLNNTVSAQRPDSNLV